MVVLKLCFEFALELDEVTTEKQMIRTGGCGQGCVGECDLPDQYSDQPLKAYFPIIRDSPVYPVVYDANGVVLSLPPIINGDHSKISTTLVQYPELAFRKETILMAKANVYIGIDESAEALAKMLNRLFPTTQNASNQLEVLIPPTRHDMLHLNRDIEKIPAVHIANPKTLEYQVVRTSLIPGLLKTLAANRKIPLPLNLFEVSDVVLADSKAEVGAKNERRVCAFKLLDCVSCYWDALGQEAGLLPARPCVVISASD
ncbi:hypothetical protein quinque_000525 [Culex quinquefasciatus]